MNILSVDLNQFAQRATLLSPDGTLLEHYVPPSRTSSADWLTRILDEKIIVVGSPLDEWPSETTAAVREAGVHLEWLNPSLMRRLYSVCRPWNLHRKLHRARFIGHLFLSRANIWDAESATREFEGIAARAILDELGQ